jgi:putative transposase
MPRQARLDSPGTLHHVMIRGIEKRLIVDDEADRREFVRRLGAVAEETRTPIYAWALMSNHAHLLLCSGASGLANFMRRFLTGYAVSYNLRHRRHGHVFQNRYKSIVCEGDSYFTELVRYIHLNPLRVELVKDLRELEKYPYCGHGTILGRPPRPWQDCQSVLAQFGRRASEGQGGVPAISYRGSCVGAAAGVSGGRTHTIGGGVVCSQITATPWSTRVIRPADIGKRRICGAHSDRGGRASAAATCSEKGKALQRACRG